MVFSLAGGQVIRSSMFMKLDLQVSHLKISWHSLDLFDFIFCFQGFGISLCDR